MLKGVCAASPRAKPQLFAPSPGTGKLPEGWLHSCGARLSWCPPCLAQGAAGWRKKPGGANDSHFGGLHPPPAARSVLGPRLSAEFAAATSWVRCTCFQPLLGGVFVAGLGARLVGGGQKGPWGWPPTKGDQCWGRAGEPSVSIRLCTGLGKLKSGWASAILQWGKGKWARRHHLTGQGQGTSPPYPPQTAAEMGRKWKRQNKAENLEKVAQRKKKLKYWSRKHMAY